MPIINPLAIDNVLKENGLKKAVSSKLAKEELAHLLSEYNLTPQDVLENLSDIMRGADSSSTRLHAVELAAKLNDLLVNNEAQKITPVVNIVINDGEFSVNPICLPREI